MTPLHPQSGSFRKRLALLATGLALTACATQTYVAAPISVEHNMAHLEARSLNSDALEQFLRAEGYAAETFPPQRWGFKELALAAYFFHPQLETARAQWKLAEAAQLTAAQRQNPVVTPSVEHHSKSGGGISPWTYGLAFSIAIESTEKRQAKRERSSQLSEAARIQIGQQAWLVRSQLRGALLDFQQHVRHADLLRRDVRIRGEIVQMLHQRLQAGMVSGIEVENARLPLRRAQQALEMEEGAEARLKARIASGIGIAPRALNQVTFDFSSLNQLVPMRALPPDTVQRTALLNRLDIRSALARYGAAEAKLRLEISKQFPDISLVPGYTYDQGDNRWSIGIPLLLALLDKNEGSIAESRAQRELEARQFDVLQMSAIHGQAQALARYRTALEDIAQAERTLAIQRDRLARNTQLFESGQIDRLEMTTLRLDSLEAERGLLSALGNAQQAQGLLEDAIQHPLNDETWPVPQTTGQRTRKEPLQ